MHSLRLCFVYLLPCSFVNSVFAIAKAEAHSILSMALFICLIYPLNKYDLEIPQSQTHKLGH